VRRLNDAGIVVSAFIEPEADQLVAARVAGCAAVELWTGAYAHARNADQQKATLSILRHAVAAGIELGLTVHAGHGLTYRNVAGIAAMPGFDEFNIGHSIVSRSMFVGMRKAVREMKALLIRHAPREEAPASSEQRES
jgi:pyridoxine 5-phosphate synthase